MSIYILLILMGLAIGFTATSDDEKGIYGIKTGYKVILIVLSFFLLSFFIPWFFYYLGMNDISVFFVNCAAITLTIAAICGAISKTITRNRGMEGGFWWGFFLWIIGIVVVALRPKD